MKSGLFFRTIIVCYFLNERMLAAVSTEHNEYSTNLLEVRLPMIKVGPPGSFFGFSVAEHRIDFSEGKSKPLGATESVLLVGAPIYDGHSDGNVERPGDVFGCPYTTLSDDCQALNIDVSDSAPKENKSDQWLGVNVRSQGPAGQIVVCAHRYLVEQSNQGKHWGLGKCYLLKQNIYDLTFVESPDETNEWIPCNNEAMKLTGFGYCQAGISLGLSTFSTPKDDLNRYMYMAIGAPGSYYFRGTTFIQDISEHASVNYFPKKKKVPTATLR